MKRPRLIRIVLVLVLLLGCLAIAIFRAREPRYQGRTLSEWIKAGGEARDKLWMPHMGPTYQPDTDPDWQVASHAVKQMAPDAIPFLLRWAQANDSRLKIRLIEWLDDHPSYPYKVQHAGNRYLEAQLGFGLLGNEAKPAWPVLIKWTSSTNQQLRFTAFLCLQATKPDKGIFLPVLLRLIHDPSKKIQL